MHMPDGERGGQPGSLVPEQWRKKPAASQEAEAAPRRRPQTADEMSARWNELQNKRGHGELTPDEEQEAADLEAQMRRMRASGMEGGSSQAA